MLQGEPHFTMTSQYDRISETVQAESWQPGSKTMRARFWQLAKQRGETVVIDEGIQTDSSDTHPENIN
jgi:hypothetical protein